MKCVKIFYLFTIVFLATNNILFAINTTDYTSASHQTTCTSICNCNGALNAYGTCPASCPCDESCQCGQTTYKSSLHLSPSKLLTTIAHICLNIGKLMHASKIKDKELKQEAIIDLAATAVNFAGDCTNEFEYHKSMEIKSNKVVDLTQKLIHNLAGSSLNTANLEEYKRHDGKHSKPFTLSILPQEERDKQHCLSYMKDMALLSKDILQEKYPNSVEQLYPLMRDLIMLISEGQVVLEEQTKKTGLSTLEETQKPEQSSSKDNDNTFTIGKLKVFNKSGACVNVTV